MSLNRIWIPSPNYSASRKQNRLLVLHTAEGAKTFRDLGEYFKNPSVQGSSHVGIDDTPGEIGEYVRPECKAWSAFAANDWGEHAELCGFAGWSREEWLNHPIMLNNTADWLRDEGERYGIPIVKLDGAAIRDGASGICGHADAVAGGSGGDHWDPGPNFPWDAVIQGRPIPPAPAPQPVPEFPPFPGRLLRLQMPIMWGYDVALWQDQMKKRGWDLVWDGFYGPATSGICRQFQFEKGLTNDGIVGPVTWAATWTAPVT